MHPSCFALLNRSHLWRHLSLFSQIEIQYVNKYIGKRFRGIDTCINNALAIRARKLLAVCDTWMADMGIRVRRA